MWSAYLKIVGSVELQSFRVRYINKLFIPEHAAWEDYIRVYPFIPEEVPTECFRILYAAGYANKSTSWIVSIINKRSFRKKGKVS